MKILLFPFLFSLPCIVVNAQTPNIKMVTEKLVGSSFGFGINSQVPGIEVVVS